MTKDDSKNVRAEIDYYINIMNNNKGWKQYKEKCHREEFKVKGPDDNDLQVICIKSLEHKDA